MKRMIFCENSTKPGFFQLFQPNFLSFQLRIRERATSLRKNRGNIPTLLRTTVLTGTLRLRYASREIGTDCRRKSQASIS